MIKYTTNELLYDSFEGKSRPAKQESRGSLQENIGSPLEKDSTGENDALESISSLTSSRASSNGNDDIDNLIMEVYVDTPNMQVDSLGRFFILK